MLSPVEFPITHALKFGAENEILIRVGDRVWLPSEAAGGTDKEKEHYLPGIWDDVTISFTGKVRVNRLLVLPSVAGKKLTVKAQLRNLNPAQIFYGDAMSDSVTLTISISEKNTGKTVAGMIRSMWMTKSNYEKAPYPLGNLDFKPPVIQSIDNAGTAQLINEYGWIWLWRNGTPSKLTVGRVLPNRASL